MSDVAKVVTIIGNSPDGFAEAAQVAVREAAETIRGISGLEVKNMTCTVRDNRITHYKVTLHVAFRIERGQ